MQHLQSFISPDGFFFPTRVLHIITDELLYLQSTLVQHLHRDLLDSMQLWLGYIFSYARTADEQLKSSRRFFYYCA